MASDEAPHDGTLEMLIADIDRRGCDRCVLVQVIYHGWDNSYPFTDAYPHVKRGGVDRLLLGTGYPGSSRETFNRPTLEREIELIRSRIPFFSNDDRQKILGGNAARLWGYQ